MSGRLQDKIAIVTGAAGGIGRSIALHFSTEGAAVACVDLRPTSKNPAESKTTTHDLITSRSGRAIFLEADLTQAAQVQDVIQKTVAEFGRLDIMVNNAGISLEAGAPLPIWETPESTYDITMAVNTKAVWLGCKYASLQMKSQDMRSYPSPAIDGAETDPEDEGERGCIINTASILGMVGTETTSSYCASKGAVVNLTRSAALDCAPLGIRVNAVAPGYTASAMTMPLFGNDDRRGELAAMHPLRGLGRPRDLARACVFLASGEAGWITGVTLPVEGGYTAR